MRIGHACITLALPELSMRAAQLGRFQRGLVDLPPIYRNNVRYAEQAIACGARHGLAAFRLSTDIFPLIDVTPDNRKHVPRLSRLRSIIADNDVHISNHPGQFVVLSSTSEKILANSTNVLRDTAWTMARIGATGSVTIHGGGVYGDRPRTAQTLAANVRALSPAIRKYLAFENDEYSWTVPELLDATEGAVPIVFDKLHWQANERSAPYAEELGRALATWPEGRLPELHYSEQAKDRPRGAHADWITGKGLLRFLEELDDATDRDCVVVIEAKKKDLSIARAVAQLRGRDRARLVELVPRLGQAEQDLRALAKIAA